MIWDDPDGPHVSSQRPSEGEAGGAAVLDREEAE